MRGKNIVWLSVIAALLMPMMMVNVAKAPVGNTKFFIDPARIPVGGGTLGHPGDSFDMAIKVNEIENLWSIAFTVKFAPFGRPLRVFAVTEGAFLGQDWIDPWTELPATSFTYKVKLLEGELEIGITRYWTWGLPWPPVGASGDGTLATFQFKVFEAGASDIEIINVRAYDPDMNPITAFNTFGSDYYGPTANLINMELASGRRVRVGGTQYFNSQAINHGDVPLIVRTRFDVERLDDGRRLKMFSGQRYLKGWFGEPPITYLYVNGFTGHYGEGWGWEYVGDPPYLDAVGDGNYIYCDIPLGAPIEDYHFPGFYPYTGRYDFETYTLGPDDQIAAIWAEAYAYAQFHTSGGRHLDFDTYMRKADQSAPSYWIGSLWASTEWTWRGVLHESASIAEIVPGITTQAGLDAARVRFILYWSETDEGCGYAAIDALRLRVDFATADPATPEEWELGPYGSPTEKLALDPMTMSARADLVGTYVVTATLEYTLAGVGWMEGDKTRTVTFEILP